MVTRNGPKITTPYNSNAKLQKIPGSVLEAGDFVILLAIDSIIINNELSLYQSDLAITGLFAVSFN